MEHTMKTGLRATNQDGALLTEPKLIDYIAGAV